ncbi:MAG TPA: NrfD/PsrC family molybdoenzyme membrane anchor subunit [Flavisolibacter sp.]
MKLNSIQQKALTDQRSHLEVFGKRTMAWSILYLATIAAGGYALYLQITQGHGITGMRDNVVWGLFIVNFIFFIGLSYAGAVICAILHLFKVKWRHPIFRVAQMMTIIGLVVGPVFILLCVGRLDRLHNLFINARLQSPMTWDVVAISTYLVGSILFFYLSIIKDLAYYRDANLKIAKWKQKLYNALSLGYRGTPAQKKSIETSTNLLAIIMVPLAIIVSSILSWIFGMTLRPGWHSTIFGPYFVLAALYSGTGVVIMALWYYRKTYRLQQYITRKHFVYLGYTMLALGAAYGYFTFSEYFTSWYVSEKWDNEVLHKLFSLSEYGWWTLFANVAGIILPIAIVAIPATRTIGWITAAAAIMVFALWVKRYLIIVPTLESPLLPIQDTRPEYINYSATWPEWVLTAAGVATFLLFFTLVAKFVTIVPISELVEKGTPEQRKELTRPEKEIVPA